MVAEDFTTFTETDPNNHISKTANHIDFKAYRNEDAYVYKDKGVDHFGTSWEHKIDVKFVSHSGSNRSALWALTNNIDDWYGIYASGNKPEIFLECEWYAVANKSYLILAEILNGTIYWSNYYLMTTGTMYYCTIKRNGTAFTCKIYSNSERTNLLATLSLTLHAGQPSHRYIFASQTMNDGTASVWGDHDIENLDIQEYVPVTYRVTQPILQHKRGIMGKSKLIRDSEVINLRKSYIIPEPQTPLQQG